LHSSKEFRLSFNASPNLSDDWSIDEVRIALREQGYVADAATATVTLLGARLDKPVLVEGPAGVGKTALALAWAKALDRRLIRLQCYEGLDEARALYEWAYGRQLLATQLAKEFVSRDATATAPDFVRALAEVNASGAEDALFTERFLIERPLLQAIRSDRPALLLIDEVDRAGEEFEALLLELLSDYQITIPELGLLTAVHAPVVMLTSNATRDLSDALKRRCLHIALDYPDAELEREILRAAVPDLDERLGDAIVTAINRVRTLDLRKRPSAGETIDWARALRALGVNELNREIVHATAGVIAKYAADEALVRRALAS
jgi:MoxR-like ATPase